MKYGRPRGRRNGPPAAKRQLNPDVEAEMRLTVAELVAQSRLGLSGEAAGPSSETGLEMGEADGPSSDMGLEMGEMGLGDEANGE